MFFNQKTLVALGFASLANLVIADSQEFGLVINRSGSQYQNVAVGVQDNELYAGATALTAVVTDNGELKLSTGEYAVVGSDSITLGTEGSTSFSISGGYLQYAGSSGFAITSGVVSVGSGSDGISYALVPYAGSSVADDFTPGSSSSNIETSSSASNETTTTSEEPQTTSDTPSNNITITTTNEPTTFDHQTDNGANVVKGAAGVAGALVAVAALLI